MKLAATFLLCAIGASAQTGASLTTKSPVISSSQFIYGIAKGDVMKSAAKIPENLWSFRPTPEVRTIAQLFAHIADGQYEFCSAAEGKPVDKGIEKANKSKDEIISAIKEAFAYCDDVYGRMTAESAVETTTFFGMKATRIGLMDFNVAHTMEHYGNLVTYMRLKSIVPPSSEGQQ